MEPPPQIRGILHPYLRLFLFFLFLILIALETYFVLHIEQEIAEEGGNYSKRIHPKKDETDKK